jgi:hypothetical protein
MNNNQNFENGGAVPVNNHAPVPLFANERVRAPCPACQGGRVAECVWYDAEAALTTLSSDLVNLGKTNNQIRYALNQKYMKLTHGTMGRGNRKELPACVEDIIKGSFPNTASEGTYTGFQIGEPRRVMMMEEGLE